MKSLIITVLVILGVRGAFAAYDNYQTNKAVARPNVTEATRPDTTLTNDTQVTNWTNFKQQVYDGCMSEPVPGYDMSAYCQCAVDYAVDSYGVTQLVKWYQETNTLPQNVIDGAVNKCL